MADIYTLPDQLPYKRYTVDDPAQVAYPYDWLLTSADEVVVYADDQVVGNYAVTGLGQVTGGSLIFTAPFGLGVTLVLRRRAPVTQNMLLQVGGLLGAVTLQNAFNRLTMLLQDVHEALTRIPTLAPTARDALRDLVLPLPSAGSPLFGWNATLDAITLYQRSIDVQIISPAVGHVYGRSVLLFPTSNGAPELRNATAQPANSTTLGVTIVVDTTFTGGLTGLLVGDDVLADRWSRSPVALTAGTLTGDGNFSASPEVPVDSALPVVIRAVGGVFGAAGHLTAVVHWRQLRNT